MAASKILIVDDDEAVRKSVGDTLVAAGYEVATASDGRQGLLRAINEKPALILLDMDMPILDGMSMLKELRDSGEWGKAVPVIILTNIDTSDEALAAILENGPSFYLLKAEADPAMILEKIQQELGSGASPAV